MADPTVVSCTKKTWTKVVDNKTTGYIYLQTVLFFSPKVYFTFVDTGGAAPTIAPGVAGNKAVAMERRSLPISVSDAIDVYIWPSKRDTDVLVSME